jgi:phage terminase large subunit GpA-like protein
MGSLNEPPNSHALPEGMADAFAATLQAFARAIAPERDLTVSAWADENRKLTTTSSAEPGPWRTARTPYLAEIMDCLTPSHPMTDGVFQKGTQVGGSEALYNWIGFVIDKAPGPAMLVMPTSETAKKISKQRIAPMISESPVLRGKVADSRSRDSGNTTLLKEFAGGMLALVGANSAVSLRSLPVRYLLLDEIDAYPNDVGGEGDPEEIAEKRTDTFGARSKRMRVSTPTIKGASRIERRYAEGTQGKYHVPCPHCSHEQVLRWSQMRWTVIRRHELVCRTCGTVGAVEGDLASPATRRCGECGTDNPEDAVTSHDTDDVDGVHYECEACGFEISEHHKGVMLAQGRWIHASPGRGEIIADDDPHPWAIWARINGAVKRFVPAFTKAVSWHLSALYSPLGWFSWTKAVKQYLRAEAGGIDEASGQSHKQVFTNTVLGEAFEVSGEQPKASLLSQRAEPYRLQTVPREALMLTAGVDVQGDRLEYLVQGWGRSEQQWTIDYGRIYGEPLDRGPEGPWAELEGLLDKAYPHAGGSTLRVTAMAVDSGFLTSTVYLFCMKLKHRHVIPTKGQSEPGKPILGRPRPQEISHHGKVIKEGVLVWPLGSDVAKEHLYRVLDQEAGFGQAHFPAGLPQEFFDQLTAEKLVRKKTSRGEIREWVLPSGRRNEVLDLFVLARAAAEYAGIKRINWDQLDRVINPKQQDLFVQPAEATNEAGSSEVARKDRAAIEGPKPEPERMAPASQVKPAVPAKRPAPARNWVTSFGMRA